MPRARRKQPSLRVKLASALLTIVRPDAHGNLVPVIGRQEAKTMTVDDILRHFEFDHAVHDVWGGSLHPSNLTPRPVAEHREKTRRDVTAIAKVRRGLKARAGGKPKRTMPYTAMKATHKRTLAGKVVRRDP